MGEVLKASWALLNTLNEKGVPDQESFYFEALCSFLEDKWFQFQNVCESEKDSKAWSWAKSF